MNVPDSIARPALPGRARSIRWGYYAVRVLLVLLLLAVAAFLPRHPRGDEKYRYRLGDIARERVVGPYDFRVQKDEGTLRREQQTASMAVPPVFVVDARVSSAGLERFQKFQQKAQEIALDASLTPAQRAVRLRALGVPLGDDNARALASPGRALLV